MYWLYILRQNVLVVHLCFQINFSWATIAKFSQNVWMSSKLHEFSELDMGCFMRQIRFVIKSNECILPKEGKDC